MKSLKSELKSLFFKIIVAFILTYLVSILMVGKYMINNAKKELRNGMNFLIYEITEELYPKNIDIFKNKNIINEMIRKENQTLNELKILIKYKDEIYDENVDKKLLKIAVDDKVKNENFYDYMILKKSCVVGESKEKYTIYLAKNLIEEKTLFLKISLIFFTGILITVIILIVGTKIFFNRLKSELEIFEKGNVNISLENLETIRLSTQFIEFKNIIHSYNDMIERLDYQNKKQVDFVNNASHELRTPIFIIGGYIDMIKRWGKQDKKVFEEALISIESEIKNMSQLIDKIFFLARDKSVKVVKTEVELSNIIMECLSALKIKYKSAKIVFIPEYMIINTDEELIKVLINNLLENAMKYGADKPIEIVLREKEKVELIIKDNGIGMNEESLERIYERFYRAENSRNKRYGGYGLGMSIVKEVVKVLKIDIEIKSEFGKGTEVKLGFNVN